MTPTTIPSDTYQASRKTIQRDMAMWRNLYSRNAIVQDQYQWARKSALSELTELRLDKELPSDANSDTCQCAEPVPWINEDEHGYPVAECETCNQPIANYFEDQEAAAADRSYDLSRD